MVHRKKAPKGNVRGGVGVGGGVWEWGHDALHEGKNRADAQGEIEQTSRVKRWGEKLACTRREMGKS